jgi:hypothetical protein
VKSPVRRIAKQRLRPMNPSEPVTRIVRMKNGDRAPKLRGLQTFSSCWM